MGAGGDARQVAREGLIKRKTPRMADDLAVLKSIWFTKAKGDDHASRLEHFYGPQAHACTLILVVLVDPYWHPLLCLPARRRPSSCCRFLPCTDDNFRSSFLWGRRPMLAACAARLAHLKGMTWVDLGGGTGVRVCCVWWVHGGLYGGFVVASHFNCTVPMIIIIVVYVS